MKRQLIVSAMLVALIVVGVLNFDTVEVSAQESRAIYISPPLVDIEGCSEIGSNYTFSICSNYTGTDVMGYAFKLTYDPTVLHGVGNATNGDVITGTPEDTQWETDGFNNTKGELGLTGNSFFYLTPPPTTVNGTGILANVTFTVVGCGISNIDFVDDDETKLIGWDGSEEYIIIDRYTPDFGHLVGAVFDHSASHDVAILDVSPDRTIVGQGFGVDINVMAENQGQVAESFTVTAYYDTTVIQTKNIINLASETSTTLTFTWDTTGVPLSSYTIKAVAETVSGETDTTDNTYVDGSITIVIIDVAVLGVTNSKTGGTPMPTVGLNLTVVMNVTVENQGSYMDDVSVTVYANTTAIRHLFIAEMPAGNTTLITFSWDTTGFEVKGNYTISAVADADPHEADTADNDYTDGWIVVTHTGDVNADGKVSITDIVIVALAFGSRPGDSNWNPNADLNSDGKVTITDIVIAALHFGETAT